MPIKRNRHQSYSGGDYSCLCYGSYLRKSFYIGDLIGIVNPNQQSRLHPKPSLEGPGNNLFYFGQYRPLSHSYNVRTGSDRADTRHRKYSCIHLVILLFAVNMKDFVR